MFELSWRQGCQLALHIMQETEEMHGTCVSACSLHNVGAQCQAEK